MLEPLHLIATFSIGVFAGALLTEACILVPYWRRMQPAEFFRLHHELGPSLFRYFAPVTGLAVFLSLASAAGTISANDFNIWRIAAAGLCLSALLIFFLYFKKANGKFAERTIPDSELGTELHRWAKWHWVRTCLVIFAFVSSILATSA